MSDDWIDRNPISRIKWQKMSLIEVQRRSGNEHRFSFAFFSSPLFSHNNYDNIGYLITAFCFNVVWCGARACLLSAQPQRARKREISTLFFHMTLRCAPTLEPLSRTHKNKMAQLHSTGKLVTASDFRILTATMTCVSYIFRYIHNRAEYV